MHSIRVLQTPATPGDANTQEMDTEDDAAVVLETPPRKLAKVGTKRKDLPSSAKVVCELTLYVISRSGSADF